MSRCVLISSGLIVKLTPVLCFCSVLPGSKTRWRSMGQLKSLVERHRVSLHVLDAGNQFNTAYNVLSHGKCHHYDIQMKYIANFDHHSSLWPKATSFEMCHIRL